MEEKLDPQFLNIDPLKEAYRESITDPKVFRRSLGEHHTALMVIDVQYLDAARGYGVFANLEDNDVPPEAQEYYFSRLQHTVLPNIRLLQDAFRARGLEVIHTRIQSLTLDGRERSPGHKRLKIHAAPGSKEAEFLPQVAPQGDELIINKTASGVFTSTNMEYVLRNMGINGLMVTGVYTNECVSTTVRDACDLGFYVTLIDDACATVTPDLHDATIRTVRDRYARILTTQDALQEVKGLVFA